MLVSSKTCFKYILYLRMEEEKPEQTAIFKLAKLSELSRV